MKDNWKTTTTSIERLRIIGPNAEGIECLRWLTENGYNVIRSGPYTDREMYPRCDIKRFLIMAEREAEF